MPGGKEWLIGAPEFKEQMYSLDELKSLIKEKRVLGTDLVLKEGGVWRSAKDYPELSALFADDAPSTRLGPKIVIEPPKPQAPPRQARIMSSVGTPPAPPPPAPAAPSQPPTQKVARKTAIIEPAKSPMRKTQVIVPGPAPAPKAPKTEKLVKPPEAPKSPTEKIIVKPPPTDRIEKSKAETAVDAAVAAPTKPPSESEETKTDDANLEKMETKSDAPAKIKPPRRERRPLPPSEPVIVALEVSEFSAEDMQRGMWKALNPLNLFVALLMGAACLFLGSLFNVTEATYLVASFLFFACAAVAHGAQAFATRCAIEKKGSVSLIVTYLKQSFSLLVSIVLGLLLLFPPTLGFSVVRQAEVQWASFTVLIVVMMTFIVFALLYVMTAGYWNAILAVEVCGPGKAASHLFKAYKHAFRLVLGHSALALILALGAFAVVTLPSLGAVLMNFGKSAAVPVDSLLLAINFGVGAGVALSVLAVANVLSYIYIRTNRFVEPAPPPEPKKDEVPPEGGSGAEPKHADTTQIELEPAKDPTQPPEPPPPAAPPPTTPS